MSKKLPEEVRSVQVMVFRNSLPSNPFSFFFLDRFKASAKTIKDFVPLSSLTVLVDSPEYISEEEAAIICYDIDDEREQELCLDTVTNDYDDEFLTLCKWFSECWKKAGGENYSHAAFVIEEYAMFKPFNLRTERYIKHFKEFDDVFDG